MPNAIDRIEAAEARLFAGLGLDVERSHVVLDRGGVDLRVLAVGEGAPVVLLTGEGQLASSWAPLLAHLDGVRAIACDLPGFGGSGGVTYGHVDLRGFGRRVVAGVLDELELDDVVLVGSSAGGAMALWAAAAMPSRIRALALFGCPGPAAAGSHLPATLVPVGLRGLDRLLLDLPLPPFRVQRRAFQSVFGRQAIDAAPPPLIEAMHHAMDRPSFAPAMTSLAESAYGFRRADPAVAASDDELRRVTMPTLVVWGEHDRYGGPRVAHRLADAIPDARLELLDAGHAPWLDRPQECAALLRGLLTDVAGTPEEDADEDAGEDAGGAHAHDDGADDGR